MMGRWEVAERPKPRTPHALAEEADGRQRKSNWCSDTHESIGATCCWAMKRPAAARLQSGATAASSERPRRLRPPEKKKRKPRQNKPYERGGISWAEGPGGRESIVPVLLRSQRREVLPVHSQGRMHALDIPGNVCRAELRQRQGFSGAACPSGAVSDPDDPDGQRYGVYQRACWSPSPSTKRCLRRH